MPMNLNVKKSNFLRLFLQNNNNKKSVNLKKVIIIADHYSIHSNCFSHLNDYANHFDHLYIITYETTNDEDDGEILEIDFNKNDCIYIIIGVNDDKLFKIISNQKTDTYLGLKYISKNIPQQIIDIFPDADFLGFQRHLVPKETIKMTEENHTESMSIGLIRSKTELLEPNLRNAKFVHFNFDACRKSDCPRSLFSLPTGLYAEEMCQITRDAADSQNINLLSFDTSGITSSDPQSPEPQLLAESIWYFLEGLNNKEEVKLINSRSHWSEFIVNLEDTEIPVIFKFSSQTGKWWSCLNNSDELIPCSPQDYQEALKGRLNDRLFKKLFY